MPVPVKVHQVPDIVYPATLPDGQRVKVEVYKAKWQGQTDRVVIQYPKWAEA